MFSASFALLSDLTGRIFRAAADDLVEGTPTVWGGKSYVRKAEDS